MADDATLAELVEERCALREELLALRQVGADVVLLDDQRALQGPKG